MFYFLNPQFIVINGQMHKYFVCECGETVEFGDKTMTIEEFCEAINETEKKET